jgi:hypothetical protein
MSTSSQVREILDGLNIAGDDREHAYSVVIQVINFASQSYEMHKLAANRLKTLDCKPDVVFYILHALKSQGYDLLAQNLADTNYNLLAKELVNRCKVPYSAEIFEKYGLSKLYYCKHCGIYGSGEGEEIARRYADMLEG